jgi:tRNA pseudouridine38-40 synthase
MKLTVEYDGTPFRGWAVQPGLPTVEAVVRDALAQTYESFGDLAVAGRTDAGVHALGNVVSVDVEGGPPLERAARALNTRLPEEVSVVSAEPVPPEFSARFSALSRSYRYRIFNRRLPSPFERRRSWWVARHLDEEPL